MMNVFTFWEGKMPAYIRLCMETWKLPYKILDYDNLREYTDIDVEKLKRFTLPQIADCVRVHVLRDNGGVWLDADTISLTGQLPEETILGDPDTRQNTIGMLRADGQQQMFSEWAMFQDEIVNGTGSANHWAALGNAFTDKYLQEHRDVKIGRIRKYWPEVYKIQDNIPRFQKYRRFYFESDFHLSDIERTDLLMLHNSWTPEWYKKLSATDVLAGSCTMSNVLREILQ